MSPCSLGLALFPRKGRQILSGSGRFTRAVLKVAGIIRVSVGSLWRAERRRGHSGLRMFTRAYLRVVGFVRFLVGLLLLA